MADKGILFAAPMVNAILDVRKFQTRRLLSLGGYRKFSEFGPSDTKGYDWTFRREDACWVDLRHEELLKHLPHRIGDRLYVRETWRVSERWDSTRPRELPARTMTVMFSAGGEIANQESGWWEPSTDREIFLPTWAGKVRQSIFLPRWASRITLPIDLVRVQRLQDISEEDALAEGIYFDKIGFTAGPMNGRGGCNQEWSANATIAYANLWRLLHTDPGTRWEDNPWVYATTWSAAIVQNIDRIAA